MFNITAISELIRQLWLVWLSAVFVGIAIWVYWPGNKKRFEEDARIIFKDESDGD